MSFGALRTRLGLLERVPLRVLDTALATMWALVGVFIVRVGFGVYYSRKGNEEPSASERDLGWPKGEGCIRIILGPRTM